MEPSFQYIPLSLVLTFHRGTVQGCVCICGLTHHCVDVECSLEDLRYPGKIWRVVSPFGSILEVKNRNKRKQKENPRRGSGHGWEGETSLGENT